MNRLFTSRDSSIRQTAETKAEQKAMYRFLDNENVTETELIDSCFERTSTLCKGKHLLVLNDTSEINMQSHVGRIKPESGVGLVGNNHDLGFFAHLGLVVDVEAYQAIGYSSMNLWHRSSDKGTKASRDYKNLPVEEKESYKWIKCSKDSNAVLEDASSVTLVGDRESDMYELFTDAQEDGLHVLARNRINRKTTEGEKLYHLLNDTKSCGNYKIDVSGDVRKQKKKREATLLIKFREVWLKKPNGKNDYRPEQVKAWIVEAKEESDKNGICWRLLTTHSVESFEQAVQMVEWYKMRWFIEEVFRLLKNKGYRIEDSQLENGWALRKLTIMLLHNILRVMQMLIAYGSSEEEDAGLCFTEEEIGCLHKLNKRCEGKTEKLKNPYKESTLKWATWIIARLGGWSGYLSQRPPGPITIKNGLDKFNHVFIGWLMAKDVGTQ
jgi:hypothetical protein